MLAQPPDMDRLTSWPVRDLQPRVVDAAYFEPTWEATSWAAGAVEVRSACRNRLTTASPKPTGRFPTAPHKPSRSPVIPTQEPAETSQAAGLRRRTTRFAVGCEGER